MPYEEISVTEKTTLPKNASPNICKDAPHLKIRPSFFLIPKGLRQSKIGEWARGPQEQRRESHLWEGVKANRALLFLFFH